MTQQWNPSGGGFDVEPLENINEVADLPDLAQLDEAQIYSLRSGNFAPDYVVPWAWDASTEEYQEWRSTVDGQAISDIPVVSVWDNKENTQEFWEENSNWLSLSVGDWDDLAGWEDDSDIVDIFDNESDWVTVNSDPSITDTATEGANDYEFTDFDGRWWQEFRSNTNTRDVAINQLGYWDVSNADTVNCRFEGDAGGSTADFAAVMQDVDNPSNFETIEVTNESGTWDFSETLDISDLDDDWYVTIIASAGASAELIFRFADIFFE